jgi:hypothetical protein
VTAIRSTKARTYVGKTADVVSRVSEIPGADKPSAAQVAFRARGLQVFTTVSSPSEMVAYMTAHIARVGVLAQALLQRQSAHFPDVKADVLAAFSQVHDRSKIDGRPSFLREHGLKAPIANDLLRLWGQSVSGKQASSIHKLNQIDASLEQAFFDSRNIAPNVAVQYQTLVSVADKVDRGMNRISKFEEMGRVLRPASAFEKNPQLQAFSRELEEHYASIVPASLDYESARFS